MLASDLRYFRKKGRDPEVELTVVRSTPKCGFTATSAISGEAFRSQLTPSGATVRKGEEPISLLWLISKMGYLIKTPLSDRRAMQILEIGFLSADSVGPRRDWSAGWVSSDAGSAKKSGLPMDVDRPASGRN